MEISNKSIKMKSRRKLMSYKIGLSCHKKSSSFLARRLSFSTVSNSFMILQYHVNFENGCSIHMNKKKKRFSDRKLRSLPISRRYHLMPLFRRLLLCCIKPLEPSKQPAKVEARFGLRFDGLHF